MVCMKSFEELRRAMVNQLVQEGIIRSEDVARAFLKVPREEFVWPDMRNRAYVDTPLPLGDTGQTISAPHMVAIMVEELELKPGHTVLEIGAGSGYSAAVMAEVLRSKGKEGAGRIVTIERVPSLVDYAKKNIERTGYSDIVTVVEGDGTLGYPQAVEEELYDRIVVTAAAPHVPRYLKAQLKVGGILLVPKGDLFYQDLVKLLKLEQKKFDEVTVCGCMFVPLIGADGYR